MAAATNAERQEALRARRAMLGQSEVRGIYAHADDHAALKEYAKQLARLRAKQDDGWKLATKVQRGGK